MTTPDRLAAAVAQGHEDAVQVWPQEDGRRRGHEGWYLTPELARRVAARGVNPRSVGCDDGACWCYEKAEPTAPVSSPAEVVLRRHRIMTVETGEGDYFTYCSCGAENVVGSDHQSKMLAAAGVLATPAPVSPPAGEDVQERAGTAEVAEVLREHFWAADDDKTCECGWLAPSWQAYLDSGNHGALEEAAWDFADHQADALAAASLLRQDPPQVAGEEARPETAAGRRGHEGWPLSPVLAQRVAARGTDPRSVGCDDSACWCYEEAEPITPPAGEDVQERAGTAEVAEVRRAFRLDPGCHEDMGDGPCGEATVAARIDSGCGDPYPVCIEHVRAVMVPLASLLRQDPPQVAGEDVERVAREVIRAHQYSARGGFCYDNREGRDGARCDWQPEPETDDWRDQHAAHVAAALSARPVEAQTVRQVAKAHGIQTGDGAEAVDVLTGKRIAPEPVEAQEVAAEDALRAEAWAAEARRERELGNQARAERDAALARAEAAEGVIEKVRGLHYLDDASPFVNGIQHPQCAHDEHPWPCATVALLDGDSEGREV